MTPPRRVTAPRNRTLRRVLIAAAAGAALLYAGLIVWRFLPQTLEFYTDADTIRRPLADAAPRDVLWQPPAPLPELINAGQEAYEPRLSWDGLTLFFVRGKAGGNADIYATRRTPTGWTDPQPLESVNSEHDDLGPEPSADGSTLYFYSDRPGGAGGYDLWAAHLVREAPAGQSDPDAAPDWLATQPLRVVNLGPMVNSPFNDYGPALTADGRTLYFASNRPLPDDAQRPNPDAWPATLREDLFRRTYDLYLASITDAGPTQAQPLTALNTPANEGSPCVSPVGDFLYFSSDRPGGLGGFDLYRSRRLDGRHLPPARLDAPVNSPANELDPGLTMGGFRLYFSSDRVAESSGGLDHPAAPSTRSDRLADSAAPRKPNDYRVYVTSSREVFVDRQTLRRPPPDWSALAALWPDLLWLLLGLLALLALLFFLRAARDRRLSLMARCVLLSLLLHSLLMLLLAAWEVGSAVHSLLRRPGSIQVALAPSAAIGEITAQVRGGLSQVEPPAPAPPQAVRTEPPAPTGPPASVVRVAVDAPAPPLPVQPSDAWVARDSSTSPPEPPVLARSLVTPPTTLIDPALPQDARRASADEPELPSIASAVRPPASERAPPPVPTSQPVGARFEAALPPDVPAATDVARAAPLADPSAVRDASATPPPAIHLSAAQPALGAASLPELATPAANAPTADVERPANVPLVAAAEPSPPRAAIAPSAASARPSAAAALAQVRPPDADDRQGPPRAGLSIPIGTADSPAGLRPDDAPATNAPAAPPLRTAALPAAQAPALDLPRLESAPDGRHAEAGVQFAADELPGSQRAPSSPDPAALTAAATTAPPRVADLAPTDAAPADVERAALVEPTRAARDALGPRSGFPSICTNLADRLPRDAADRIGLRLPAESAPPESAYAQRRPEQRQAILERMGGSDETERAVALALNWLARHQSADGRWAAGHFDADCGQCGGEPEAPADIDVATTGLALLCFLGAGHAHLEDGPYRQTVRRGIDWLRALQRPDGDLRDAPAPDGADAPRATDAAGNRRRETMYSHGIAAIALSEAFGMTRDAALLDPARRAAHFIVEARNRRRGGWRYEPGQEGDTSVLGWQVMALKSAELAGIDVPREGFDTARAWLELASTPRHPGLYAYRPRQRPTEAMTAEGLFVQQLLGLSRGEPRMRESALFVARRLPEWRNANTYGWYYATLALFQHQGEPWERWNAALKPVLLHNQRRDGPARGSWDPVGEWTDVGGRVYQTALCTLMLEVYYRYLPLYAAETPAAPAAIGVVRGRVSDGATGLPLFGAAVQLTLPDRDPLTATTSADGRYELSVPQVPEHFALSASHAGYVPATANVPASSVIGNRLTQNFVLLPLRRDLIVLESQPEVHHLGNDLFEGAINSQFQRASEGLRYEAAFELDPSQLPPPSATVRLAMLTRGVQCPHEVYVNGRFVGGLDGSPSDGSFGRFVLPFDAGLLRPGVNRIAIQDINCSGDLDDFEFVNLQVQLSD